MKIDTKKLLLALAVGSALSASAILNKKEHKLVSTATASKTEQNEFIQQLKEMKAEAYQLLARLGLTPTVLAEYKANLRVDYLKEIEPQALLPHSNESINELVAQTVKAFDIDSASVSVILWSHPSPAASTEKAIYINEDSFLQHSKPAQQFIIGHETQHIINQDSFIDYIIQRYVVDNGLAHDSQTNALITELSTLTEAIADLQCAITNQTWAERYQVYAQETMAFVGEAAKSSHPKNSERLELAQNIVNHMNSNNIA